MQNVQGFLLINLYAFLLIVSTCVIFFEKKHLKQIEGATYSKFLIANLFVSLTGLILGLLVSNTIYANEFLISIANKCYLISLFFWVYYFTFYTVYVALKNKNKIDKFIPIFKCIKYLSIILIILLPVTVVMDKINSKVNGYAIMYTYLVCGIGIIIQIICLIANYKNLKNKKFIPIYLLIFLGGVIFSLQVMDPSLNYLINPTLIFIAFIMYHTIENPDIKMLSEIYKNKELVEQTYVDKSNFLFEMTQEVRSPLMNLSNLCKSIKDEDDIDTIKEKLKLINNRVRELDFVVKDVLDVSSLDIQKIKFIRNKYNLKTIYEDVINKVKSSMPDNIEFRTKLKDNIPYLEGDYIKLKQVLLSLLLNSVKKTKEGFIEFKIDTIERYDVCRLIFTITDSGTGMSIDKINEILSTTSEFDSKDVEDLEKSDFNIKLCQKIAKAAGGNLLIKSNPGKGTEIILTIDQAIYNPSSKESIIDKYESAIVNKRVLIISQDKEINSIIKKKLQEENITTSIILNGNDGIDKIKSKKTYDYVIIQDEMNGINGYNTMKEITKINKKIPLILLMEKNKENIKDHYIDDGFKDYIIKENVIEDLNRIIKKY